MKIKQNNRFKIKNIEFIRQLKEGNKLVDKYKVFINDAMGGIPCHNRSFGSKEDFEYGSNYEVLSQFYAEKGYMELSCCAFGGMCGFTFDTDEISSKTMNNLERECAGYVQNYINNLAKAGIIEVMQDDLIPSIEEIYGWERESAIENGGGFWLDR